MGNGGGNGEGSFEHLKEPHGVEGFHPGPASDMPEPSGPSEADRLAYEDVMKQRRAALAAAPEPPRPRVAENLARPGGGEGDPFSVRFGHLTDQALRVELEKTGWRPPENQSGPGLSRLDVIHLLEQHAKAMVGVPS